MNYLSVRTYWPLWILPMLVVSSALCVPIIRHPGSDIDRLVAYVGYGLIAIWWILAWKNSAARIDWIIHSALVLLMPILAPLFVGVVAQLLKE